LDNPVVQELTRLAQQQRIIMLGFIRQEILSGVRDNQHFERLRNKLRYFYDFPLETEDFETAATFYNICRAKGVQGSQTDFLLCAVAQRYNFAIFTTDKDFEHYQKHLDFKLHSVTHLQAS
jgi:hypothetical protein